MISPNANRKGGAVMVIRVYIYICMRCQRTVDGRAAAWRGTLQGDGLLMNRLLVSMRDE